MYSTAAFHYLNSASTFAMALRLAQNPDVRLASYSASLIVWPIAMSSFDLLLRMAFLAAAYLDVIA